MAASVVRDGHEILSSIIHTQTDVHQPYGGVVPELASRDHVRAISSVVEKALAEAGVRPNELTGIAVTAGPGLIGSLLVGLSFGKALAFRFGLPLVGVHHLEGHLASVDFAETEIVPPLIGLVVSGGHTALYRIEADGSAVSLGATRDDAVGEAFDKIAKLLGLAYPGGPSIEKAAQAGNEKAIAFPRPMAKSSGLDFSYSGLKTAVVLEVERRKPLKASDVADVAASFQAAATDILITRTQRAVKEQNLARVAVVGGVAANQRLREGMKAAAKKDKFELVFPPLSLCTDNAAMIANAGTRLLARGESHDASLNAFSRAPLGKIHQNSLGQSTGGSLGEPPRIQSRRSPLSAAKLS